MAEPSEHDLGNAEEIDVESIGEPGHRTFRLLTEKGDTTLSLWVEKEQLEALTVVIDQQISQTSARGGRPESVITNLAGRFPGKPTMDFKAARLAVGYDERRQRLVFTAHNIDEDDDVTIYRWAVSLPQARALSAKIADIVAAGRPRCPLCGAPIDGAHVCPASNGRAH